MMKCCSEGEPTVRECYSGVSVAVMERVLQ